MSLSLPARLLFIGLWNFCDDNGVHPASTIRLKAEVFPGDTLDSADVRRMIDELIAARLVNEYEVDGDRFWIVTGWHHQKIDQPTFRFPLPDGTIPAGAPRRRKQAAARAGSANDRGVFGEQSSNDQRTFDGRTPPESSRVESNGAECGSNSRRHNAAGAEAVDNSPDSQQKTETTTEGNRADSQNLNPGLQESGDSGAADAPDDSAHGEGGASGMAGGNREPEDDIPPLAVSVEWLIERGVRIDASNDLLIGWRRAGVTEGQFTLAIAKAKQYKLAHIPANYLATIIEEMVNPPERAAKRIAIGDDLESLQAAAKALGMDGGRQGESKAAYKARILARMHEGRQPA
ncbi:hypothetical protein [Burkholderia sp. Ac-20353]|uniref:hypothetical protein n=1 Tax=Burkholderia sp. Ac-20353 TaxID=2703894 RepID=UPI00197C5BB7|nr:hypothetical protein [Burkholderia sp. Ac-20353]MBN3789716.1 hypothetical protein [Burkholderia sp. Ac-20353]